MSRPDRPAGPEGQDWLILKSPAGGAVQAFQKVAELGVQHERASRSGARLPADRSDDQKEPLRVYADPARHPFASLPLGDLGCE